MGGIISRGCGFRSIQTLETPDENQDESNSERDRVPRLESPEVRLARSYLDKANGAGAWMSRHALLGFDEDHHSLSRDQLAAGGTVSSSLQRSKSVGSLARKPFDPRTLYEPENLYDESDTIQVGTHRISADPHRLLRHLSHYGRSQDDIRTRSSSEAHVIVPSSARPAIERWFVPRTLPGAMSKADTEKNCLFAARASWACLDIASKIQLGECKTLMDLWDAATALRMTTTTRTEFASPRIVYDVSGDNDRTRTPIRDDYNVLLLQDGKNGAVDASKLNVPQRQDITIGGKAVPLTELSFNAPYSFNDTPFNGMMIHTDPEHIPVLMEHCDRLMQEVLSDSVTPTREDKLKRLGEMQWVMAQAMPDKRGSAFKSEFCTRAVALAKDIVLPPYKGGIAPDLEAFASPKDDFVRRFAAAFDPARADESLFEQP